MAPRCAADRRRRGALLGGQRGCGALLVLAVCCCIALDAETAAGVGIERHLSTKTRYANLTAPPGGVYIDSVPPPEGCQPIFLDVVSRHGSRYPTKRKMEKGLGLREVIARAKSPEFADWRYIHSGELYLAGQLNSVGEEELRALGARFRERFPLIFKEEFGSPPYPSTTISLRSSKKHRSTASAVSFMLGAAPGRAFTMAMDPEDSDPLMRFFDTCPAYQDYKGKVGECMDPFKHKYFGEMAPELSAKLQLEGEQMTASDVAAFWSLCQQEAMEGRLDWACSLFTAEQTATLEWLEDVEFLEEKAYGSCLPYQIASPLLNDTLRHLRSAAEETRDGARPLLRAALRFGHAETIIPYSAILGMFGSPGACDLASCGHGAGAGASCSHHGWAPGLPKPPASRDFQGSVASPYGANVAHVLYHCPEAPVGRRHLIRTLHNEYTVPLPVCGEINCPLETFLTMGERASREDDISAACVAWDNCPAIGKEEL